MREGVGDSLTFAFRRDGVPRRGDGHALAPPSEPRLLLEDDDASFLARFRGERFEKVERGREPREASTDDGERVARFRGGGSGCERVDSIERCWESRSRATNGASYWRDAVARGGQRSPNEHRLY